MTNKGFALIEIIVGMFLLGIISSFTFATLSMSTRGFNKIGHRNEMNYIGEMVIEKLKTEVVDLEDISGGISITDLNFSDFRVDLTGYLKENREKLEQRPTGLYSLVEIPDEFESELKPGVIFLLEQVSGEINNLEKNPLHPYYLIYVRSDGEIEMSYDKSKQLLDYYKKICYKNVKTNKELISNFNQSTDYGKNMDKYSQLGIASLFHKGGTSVAENNVDGLEDFELISFLILER